MSDFPISRGSNFTITIAGPVAELEIEIELKKIFPGSFTAILKKIDNNLSQLVTHNLSTVGIRIPNFNPILKVVEHIKSKNIPVNMTSVLASYESGTSDGAKKGWWGRKLSNAPDILKFSIVPPVAPSKFALLQKSSRFR